MTRGIPKKRQRDEQLRLKRAQAASVLVQGALKPVKAIQVAARRSRPSVGLFGATPEPLEPHTYPAKRVTQGKRQVPGGGSS